jgi:MFS family permease
MVSTLSSLRWRSHSMRAASPSSIGPMGLIVILSANVAGRHIDRFGIRATLATGMTLLGLGVLCWALFDTSATYLSLVLPAVVVMSLGQGIAFVALTAASLTDVEERFHGVAGAVNITAQQVGGSVGVALLVLLATAVGSDTPNAAVSVNGSRWAFVAAAALCIAVAVTTMLDHRSLRRNHNN